MEITGHAHRPLVFAGDQLDGEGLDDGHQSHIGVCRHRDGTQQLVMYAVGGVLIWLAIEKDFEPALLMPMGFGAVHACWSMPRGMRRLLPFVVGVL